MTVPMIGLIKMLLSRFPTPQVLLYSLLLNLSIVFGFWVSSSPVSKRRKPRLPPRFFGGDGGIRTHDLRVANAALSQLSYTPGLAASRSIRKTA